MVQLFNSNFLEIDVDPVNMVLVDPPYGTTNCKWDSTIPLGEMWKWLKKCIYKNTPILIFGTEPFSSTLRLSNIQMYKYDIIWDKVVPGSFLNAKKQPLRRYENICVFYKKQPLYNPQMHVGLEENHSHKTKRKTNNIYGKHHEVPTKLTKLKYPSNIIKINSRCGECNNVNRVHPTQKPVKLLTYLIETYTNEGDTVLDFTMGSGSTGVACIETNREFIGIEIDKNFFDIAVDRINEARSINESRIIQS